MLRVLGLSDNVVDKYMHIRTIYPGGNTLNFAIYAKVSGTEADYLGMFEDDEAAAHVYDTIRDLELGLSHCRFYPRENGHTKVRLDNGDRVFISPNRDGVSREHPLKLTAMDRAYIVGYDIVRINIFSYIEDELPLLHQASSFVSMDFSDEVDEEYLRQYAPHVNCASISCGGMPGSEIEEQTTLIRKFGCKHIAITTRGARGALVMVDGRLYGQSPCLVETVGTMGAGDSLIICFLISYVDAMEDPRDFSAVSGTEGTVAAADYRDLAVGTSLHRVAVCSAGNYQKNGSFGFGKMFQSE